MATTSALSAPSIQSLPSVLLLLGAKPDKGGRMRGIARAFVAVVAWTLVAAIGAGIAAAQEEESASPLGQSTWYLG